MGVGVFAAFVGAFVGALVGDFVGVFVTVVPLLPVVVVGVGVFVTAVPPFPELSFDVGVGVFVPAAPPVPDSVLVETDVFFACPVTAAAPSEGTVLEIVPVVGSGVTGFPVTAGVTGPVGSAASVSAGVISIPGTSPGASVRPAVGVTVSSSVFGVIPEANSDVSPVALLSF